jgi:hypothetical protein
LLEHPIAVGVLARRIFLCAATVGVRGGSPTNRVSEVLSSSLCHATQSISQLRRPSDYPTARSFASLRMTAKKLIARNGGLTH